MQIPVGLIQFILIVLWYVVPSFATVPWYVIFLPTLLGLAILGFVLLLLLMMVILRAIVN